MDFPMTEILVSTEEETQKIYCSFYMHGHRLRIPFITATTLLAIPSQEA